MRPSTGTSHQLHPSRNEVQTVLSRWKSSNGLQAGIIPRRRFCRKSNRLKINIRWRSVHIWSHTFAPTWACKKQTAVSYGSTEAEIMSIDAGFWMDGIPAMNLWDTIIGILPLQARGDSSTSNPKTSGTIWRH